MGEDGCFEEEPDDGSITQCCECCGQEEEAGEHEIAQQLPVTVNDDSDPPREPVCGIADIVDVTGTDPGERGDLLSPNCPRRSYTVATDIRRLEEMNSSGLQIEYRCTRCRACRLCKDADFTERTSLRQDAEDELIKESVTLDYANKRIMASLPIRGPEEEFLASNRPTAKHTLDGQCKKAQKTPEDIPTIKKSFKKLFDRCHCA